MGNLGNANRPPRLSRARTTLPCHSQRERIENIGCLSHSGVPHLYIGRRRLRLLFRTSFEPCLRRLPPHFLSLCCLSHLLPPHLRGILSRAFPRPPPLAWSCKRHRKNTLPTLAAFMHSAPLVQASSRCSQANFNFSDTGLGHRPSSAPHRPLQSPISLFPSLRVSLRKPRLARTVPILCLDD